MTLKKKKAIIGLSKPKKKVIKKPKVISPSFSQVSYSLQEVSNVLDVLERNSRSYSKPSKDLLSKIFTEWATSKEASKDKDSNRIVPFLKGIASFYAA